MARPYKEGVDYFPLDCHFSDSVKLLLAEFGPMGIGILVLLWQKIYGGKGFYTPWDNDVALMFAKETGAGVNVVREVISACLRRGIFDREKFESYHILTSRGIQERYAEATERRAFQKIDGRYLLVAMPENWVIADNNSVNDDNNAVNVDKSTQSKGKGKETKVNESISKEKEIKETAVPPQKAESIMLSFADGFFTIDLDKQKEYIKRYPSIDVFEELSKMKAWLSSHYGKHDHKLKDKDKFINGWLCGTNREASEKSESSLIEKSHDAEEFFKAAVKHSMAVPIE